MEVFRAVELYQRNDFAPRLPGLVVDPAALQPRVAEGMQSDARQHARFFPGDGLQQMSVDSQRHGVARDLVCADRPPYRGRHPHMRGVDRGDDAGLLNDAQAVAVFREVAGRDAGNYVQSLRPAVGEKRFRQLAQYLVGGGKTSESPDTDHVVISN